MAIIGRHYFDPNKKAIGNSGLAKNRQLGCVSTFYCIDALLVLKILPFAKP